MLFVKKYKKVLIVEGMHCGHCAKKVEDVLMKIDGVVSVKVNLDKKEVIVSSKVELKDSSLYEAVTSIDFEVVSIN